MGNMQVYFKFNNLIKTVWAKGIVILCVSSAALIIIPFKNSHPWIQPWATVKVSSQYNSLVNKRIPLQFLQSKSQKIPCPFSITDWFIPLQFDTFNGSLKSKILHLRQPLSCFSHTYKKGEQSLTAKLHLFKKQEEENKEQSNQKETKLGKNKLQR